MQMPNGEIRKVLLNSVRAAMMWTGGSDPTIERTCWRGTRQPNLTEQREAIVADKALTDFALSVIERGREAARQMSRLYVKPGCALREDQLLVDFYKSFRDQGLHLLQNKVRGAFLEEYIMERWKAQYRSYRAELTKHFAGVTVNRTMIVVGGVDADQILQEQSKDRTNAMHDQQIDSHQREMERQSVRWLWIQGDEGTTASGLSVLITGVGGVLTSDGELPDISYVDTIAPNMRHRSVTSTHYLGRLGVIGDRGKKCGETLAPLYTSDMKGDKLVPFFVADACANPSHSPDAKLVRLIRDQDGNPLLTAVFCRAHSTHGDLKTTENYNEPMTRQSLKHTKFHKQRENEDGVAVRCMHYCKTA
jgi:hypothetical protein